MQDFSLLLIPAKIPWASSSNTVHPITTTSLSLSQPMSFVVLTSIVLSPSPGKGGVSDCLVSQIWEHGCLPSLTHYAFLFWTNYIFFQWCFFFPQQNLRIYVFFKNSNWYSTDPGENMQARIKRWQLTSKSCILKKFRTKWK